MEQGFRGKIFCWLIITISFFVFLSNLRQWWQFKKLKTEKKQFQNQIEEKEANLRKLKEFILYAKTDEFIKKELKKKLSLGEENEKIVVLPQLSLSLEETEDRLNLKISPWKAWYQLFR